MSWTSPPWPGWDKEGGGPGEDPQKEGPLCPPVRVRTYALERGFLWRVGPWVSEGGSSCAPRLKSQHLPWALSNQTPSPTPSLHPTVSGWACPAPMQDGGHGQQRQPSEEGRGGRHRGRGAALQAGQEAASAPWEGCRLPGKTLRTRREGLVSQAGNSPSSVCAFTSGPGTAEACARNAGGK